MGRIDPRLALIFLVLDPLLGGLIGAMGAGILANGRRQALTRKASRT